LSSKETHRSGQIVNRLEACRKNDFPCREIVDTVREYLGVSPAVRQHLANSRVEFLKALREMLDARIEHLSSQPQKGTKVAVE
jgi:hypothetical protein